MKLKHLGILTCILPLASIAMAQNESPLSDNIIRFNAEIQKEVVRDLNQVTLFTQEENSDLKKLGANINKKLEQAVAAVQTESAVEIKNNFRTTQVRYDKQGKQIGWIDRGTLVLQSKDSAALSKVIAELNSAFAIEDVANFVSPETIAAAEEDMIKEALKRFEYKAGIIQAGLKAKSYQIIELEVNTPEQSDDNVLFAKAAYANENASFSSYEKSTQPLPATKTTLRASVNARIKLIKD